MLIKTTNRAASQNVSNFSWIAGHTARRANIKIKRKKNKYDRLFDVMQREVK